MSQTLLTVYTCPVSARVNTDRGGRVHVELVEGDVVNMSEAEAELLLGPGGVQDDEVHPHLQIRRYVDKYVDMQVKT